MNKLLCVKNSMYLKFTVVGELEEIVKSIFPNSTEEKILRDYENVYEWVWLELPSYDIRLNISREHEWGQEKEAYPIYVSAFQLIEDKHVINIPKNIIEQFKSVNYKTEVYEGRYDVEKPDGTPIHVL